MALQRDAGNRAVTDLLGALGVGPLAGWAILKGRTVQRDVETFLRGTGQGRATSGSIATTARSRDVTAHFFPGTSEERALVIGGVHGSELSGIEVANRLVGRLSAPTARAPYFTVIIVPQLFPDAVARRRAWEAGLPRTPLTPREYRRRRTRAGDPGRNTPTGADPNRQFPARGDAFDPAQPHAEIELENRALLMLIQRFRPSRIASLHAIKDITKAGVFADPHPSVTSGPDRASDPALAAGADALARDMARRVARGGGRVPGNRLGTGRETSLYPGQDPSQSAQQIEVENARGITLGQWAPSRGMSVITVELPEQYDTSSPVAEPNRAAEIESHVEALEEIFLGPPPSATGRGPRGAAGSAAGAAALAAGAVAGAAASAGAAAAAAAGTTVQRSLARIQRQQRPEDTGERDRSGSTPDRPVPADAALVTAAIEILSRRREDAHGARAGPGDPGHPHGHPEVADQRTLWCAYKAAQGVEDRAGEWQAAQGERRVVWLEAALRVVRPILAHLAESDATAAAELSGELEPLIDAVRSLAAREFEAPKSGVEPTVTHYEFLGASVDLLPGRTRAHLPQPYRKRLGETARDFDPSVVSQDAIHQVHREAGVGTVHLYYAARPVRELVLPPTRLAIHGVEVPVAGATVDEVSFLRESLILVPGPHLELCLRARPGGIVFADWTGSRSESTVSHRLTGGANLPAGERGSRRQRGRTPAVSGSRIEITHTTAAEGLERVRLTILHEVAHGIQAGDRRHRIIPRTVARNYGSSVHAGDNEQPAYAYMDYLINPGRLVPRDRAFFDASFGRQGLTRQAP